ncbi:MAG: phenylalanine--tRNA ligase subunit beta [Lentisphaeria bacterium]|nr:phenylalanine--tRNA ligase subunit beta [Lentisphaeria bacterium]
MKTSTVWLQDYIEITETTAELTDSLTMAGLEVEGIETQGINDERIIVAEILNRVPHANSDHLSVCQVQTGSEELQIVCGAPNCDAGSKVALATIGTDFGDFKIKKGKIRGEVSFGMMCSESELGFAEESDGILILPEDAPIGTPLKEYLKGDVVVDWEVTPNRPDWLSHLGIAREIQAMTGRQYCKPEVPLYTGSSLPEDVVKVTVKDSELCPRYIARALKNVTIKPSPKWMQDRLNAVGVRPINNVVDITNFVMLECGQPLHAFDATKLAGRHIIVRTASEGEKMVTLDDGEHELKAHHLVIADSEKAVALAGVMGGANSEITEDTNEVILESAAFYAPSIRKTSKELGLSSDSSYRFERGGDIEMVEWASRRASQLLIELADAELVDGVTDVYPKVYEPHQLTLRYDRVNSILGIKVPDDKVNSLLEDLGLGIVSVTASEVVVAVPSFRRDLDREIDLIEEVVRLYGYDKIPAKTPEGVLGGDIVQDGYYAVENVRNNLVGLGFDECVHVAVTSEKDALAATDYKTEELVRIDNPLGQEYAIMRPSVMPSLVATIERNIAHGNHDIKLFEIGKGFAQREGRELEELEICMVISGLTHPDQYSSQLKEEIDFYDVSGAIVDLFDSLGLALPEFEVNSHPVLDASASADIKFNGRSIGYAGKLSRKLTKGMRARHDIFVAQINLKPILKKLNKVAKFEELPTFPETARDIAFVASDKLTHKEVLDAIKSFKVKILEDVQLFDVYRDEKAFGADKKSMAYSLSFRSTKKTLTDKEVNKAYEMLRKGLEAKLAVELR